MAFRPNYRQKRYFGGPISAAIIDVDGVFNDNGLTSFKAGLAESFASRGVTLTESELKLAPDSWAASDPTGKKNIVRGILNAVEGRWLEKNKKPATDWDIEAIMKEVCTVVIAKAGSVSAPVTGGAEAIAYLKNRGAKVIANADWPTDVASTLCDHASHNGFTQDGRLDANTTSSDRGAPLPWRIVDCATKLGIYPFESFVKVTSTAAGIEEALNAGVWAIGVSSTGQAGADPAHANRLYRAGAHVVIDGLWDLQRAVDFVEGRLAVGEKP